MGTTAPPEVPERRPIAARERAWSRAVARLLARWGASPNGISVAGMGAGVLAGAALAITRLPGWETAGFVLGAAFVQLRLAANMFDGMVAIEQQRTSPLGTLFNEMPDRVSDAATLIGAGYAAGGDPTLGYLAACLALMTAYVRAQGKAAGAPQEFCGPMAKPQRMFVVTVAALYAGLLPRAWQPALEAWPGVSTAGLALLVIVAGSAVTVVRRVVRIGRALRRAAP